MEDVKHVTSIIDKVFGKGQFRIKAKEEVTEAIDLFQVHSFADGGQLGCGAAIFLRWKLRDGSHQCFLVIVKPVERKKSYSPT